MHCMVILPLQFSSSYTSATMDQNSTWVTSTAQVAIWSLTLITWCCDPARGLTRGSGSCTILHGFETCTAVAWRWLLLIWKKSFPVLLEKRSWRLAGCSPLRRTVSCGVRQSWRLEMEEITSGCLETVAAWLSTALRCRAANSLLLPAFLTGGRRPSHACSRGSTVHLPDQWHCMIAGHQTFRCLLRDTWRIIDKH